MTQVTKILGAWEAVVTPLNVIDAFKQTELHSIWIRAARSRDVGRPGWRAEALDKGPASSTGSRTSRAM
jgi:hypothetical protein